MADGSASPASKILNQMFGSAGAHNEVSDLVDHNRFGGSMPRAFSPGLSSIGAAGFGMGGRVSAEGVAEQKRG